MQQTRWMPGIAAALLLLAPSAWAVSARKTVPVPRREVKLNVREGKAEIRSVEIQNYPDEDQIRKARREDPSDKVFTFWNFHVDNRSDRGYRARIQVEIIGRDGAVAQTCDRKATMDAGKVDDNIRVMCRVKILDLVDAKNARLTIDLEPK